MQGEWEANAQKTQTPSRFSGKGVGEGHRVRDQLMHNSLIG